MTTLKEKLQEMCKQDFQGLAENAVRMLTAQLNKKPVRNIALPYIFGKAAKYAIDEKSAERRL